MGAVVSVETSRDAVVSMATALLDQQLWCWGQDIKHAEGNLLLRHGFARLEPPEEHRCSSLYRLCSPMGSRVMLRGFGVFYGEDGTGGVFVRREHFSPMLTARDDLLTPPWWPEDLPALRFPDAGEVPKWRYLSCTLLRWIRFYESWIEKTVGLAYRSGTLERWESSGRPVVPAVRVQDSWTRLERLMVECPDAFQGAEPSEPLLQPAAPPLA